MIGEYILAAVALIVAISAGVVYDIDCIKETRPWF